MAKFLLIDGNALGNAAQDAPKLTIGDEQIQAVFGFIKMIHRILREYPNHIPMILWDGRAQWRYDLFSQYKGNRDNLKPEAQAERDAYKAQRPKIQQAMSLLGVKQITDKTAEADDLAGYFTRALKADEIVLITGDGDWMQLVDDRVSWHRPINPEKRCNALTFKEITGFDNVRQFIDAKCLVGDTSDNIPGVGGIGEKGVGEFLEKYGSVVGFLKEMSKEGALQQRLAAAYLRLALNQRPKPSSKYGEMAPAKQAYLRNFKLMNLRGDYKPGKGDAIIDRGSFDKGEFELFCKEHLFRSILTNFDNWIQPFEKLTKAGE